MVGLAIKIPIGAIIGASSAGALFAVESAADAAKIGGIDYSTPSVIIGVLFAFIAACSTILYKVVLSPLFNVFIESLKNAEEDKRTIIKALNEKLERLDERLDDLDRQKKG